MANIIITNQCNLKCPYCFASQITNQDINHIQLQQFEKIANWLINKTGDTRIGLIGGEPTLHPHFDQILLKMQEYHNLYPELTSTLFTNGLNLLPYLDLIPNEMNILININKLNTSLNQKLLEVLDTLYEKQWLQDQYKVKVFPTQKITLGCNLYPELTDYNFFWDIIERYPEINKFIRISVAAPTKEEDKNNKQQYYENMLPIFTNFIIKSKQYYFKILNDCNQLPICYLKNNPELLKYLESYAFHLKSRICEPVIDINQNFEATCCFGISELVDCTKFKNVFDLNKYFEYKIISKKLFEKNQICQNCDKFKYMQCQGGCFAFNE